MKLLGWVLAVLVLALLLDDSVSAGDAGSSPFAEAWEPWLITPFGASSTGASSALAVGNLTSPVGAGTNVFLVTTKRLASIPLLNGTNRTSTAAHNISPAPGIYKTEPFACMVIVPGATRDDRMVIQPPNPEQKMPIVRPNLRFVPLARK